MADFPLNGETLNYHGNLRIQVCIFKFLPKIILNMSCNLDVFLKSPFWFSHHQWHQIRASSKIALFLV